MSDISSDIKEYSVGVIYCISLKKSTSNYSTTSNFIMSFYYCLQEGKSIFFLKSFIDRRRLFLKAISIAVLPNQSIVATCLLTLGDLKDHVPNI